MRKRLRVAALLMAVLLAFGAVFRAGGALAADGKTTVRIPCGINSLLYFDEDGEPAGYCKEYLDALARTNNWEYEYVEATWSEALEGLESGAIDIIFPVSYTPERQESMDFSSIVGGYTASGLFVRETADYGYDDFESFDGVRVAVTEGSSNESALADFAARHGFGYTPVYLGTTDEKTAALARGEVDMIIFSAANEVEGAKLVSVLDAEPFYYAVKKGNSELLEQLDSGMQSLLMREPELVASAFEGALAGTNNENRIAFSRDEQRFVAEGRAIKVGFYRNTEPLAYVGEGGECMGIYAEILREMEQETGLIFELVPIDRSDKWQDLVKDGTVDFYIGSSSAIDVERDGLISTTSFMEFERVLIVESDFSYRDGETIRIALTSGRAYMEQSLKKDFLGAEIVYCDTAKDCLLAVRAGKADAALLNTIEYNYQSKNPRFAGLVQWGSYMAKAGATMTASQSVDPIMLSAVDKAIDSLSSGRVSDIVNSNLNIAYESGDLADSIYAARNVLMTVGILLFAAIVTAIIVASLRRRQRAAQRETERHEREQLQILAALSRDYSAIYYVHLDDDRFIIVELTNRLRREVAEVARSSQIFSVATERYIENFVRPEYRQQLRLIVKKETLIERFKESKDFSMRYQVLPNDRGQDYFEMHFVDVSEKADEHIMVLGFRCVDDMVREEVAQRNALKEAFDAANAASRAKSEFLSKMSHDIRTPMNGIIGMTAIAAAHIDDKERVQDSLAKITTSSRHLLALINEVLDMSKIESGKIELAEEEFNLSELLNNLLQMVQPQIAEKHHRLEVHILNIEHEDVVGDSLRIQQAFVNIMGNAIKYTPDGGQIRLTVREMSCKEPAYGRYEFVFEDNGIGMSAEFLEHIFEPFSRAEDDRISKTQGTGLGMAITQNIVRMMNGDIQVESEEGKGSRFTVTVFLKLQNTRESDPEELAGLPVLVADDDQIACEATCQMLDEIGMQSKWVLSGEEAVEEVRSAHGREDEFYAVILDWKMPGMDGLETAKAIRREVGDEIPIIILSAYDWSDIEQEARAAGVDAFLSKPVFKSGLVRLFKTLKNGGESEEQQKRALDSVMQSDYSDRRALLVEDNELNREIAAEILGMTGMAIESAENGKAAVDKFLASPVGYYDAVFMDIQMPVMNGYDATVAIRALDRLDAQRVPIFAMTANAFVEDVQSAKTAGMNEHLAKPLDFDKLSEVLKKYFG